jgi:probable HAF family extracellular repeat protein
LGGDSSSASAINDIVGDSTTSDGEQHAFLFVDGVMTGKFGTDGIFNAGTGINDNGQVVGYAQVSVGVTHAVICTLTENSAKN